MARGFLSQNSIPIFVLGCVTGGLVLAANLDRRSPSTPTSESRSSAPAETSVVRVVAPAWRALPDAATPLTRIGFGSCLHQNKPQPIWRSVIGAKPDVFVMLGDNVYGDVKSDDLRELKAAYATQAAHPEFGKAVSAFPMLATWDDHDYGKNDGGADFKHRDAARDVFNAFWKGSGSLVGAPANALYNARMFGPEGKRVQLILLDTRSARSPLTRKPKDAPGKGKYSPDPDGAKTMLGATQWVWLANELKKPADLRIIASSIQVLADGHAWERWGNLTTERQRLFDLIKREKASGVVFLSGDRHRASIYRNGGAGPYPLYEITSSSLNFPFADPTESGPYQLDKMYGDVNFGMLEMDWEKRTVSMTLRGGDGAFMRSQTVALEDLSVP